MSRFLFGRYVERDLREIRDYAREDLLPASYRFWPVGSYLLTIYLPDRHPIEIVAVVHGARDVPAVVNSRLE